MDWTPADPRALARLRAALLDHYDRACRALPWRGEADPYRILVSEVMLQQTRVETVVPRYGQWLQRFPDLASLAGAHEDEVLKAWEGLGYYRRARNLHRAAQLARERPDGALPSSYAELRELPGLGEYTAGAVASIAFGEAVPAADGNVRRVLARLFDQPRPSASWLRDQAAALVHPDRPGDWNQALMELGATLCTPRAPRCAECPVAAWCAARAAGTEGERPERVRRPSPRRSVFALAVLHAGGRVLLERRPLGGLLAGMWALPEAEVGGAAEARSAAVGLASARDLDVSEDVRPLPACEHRFTHLHATYQPFAIAVSDPRARAGRDAAWVDARRPTRHALPVAQRRVLESFLQLEPTEVA
ncbi:MAG: A/G-specific adenine glycosylase [Gemmatimonadetes bacterium]|nr:A/G-specific adenine glycosylase [Gemmatimonadota bacterium]